MLVHMKFLTDLIRRDSRSNLLDRNGRVGMEGNPRSDYRSWNFKQTKCKRHMWNLQKLWTLEILHTQANSGTGRTYLCAEYSCCKVTFLLTSCQPKKKKGKSPIYQYCFQTEYSRQWAFLLLFPWLYRYQLCMQVFLQRVLRTRTRAAMDRRERSLALPAEICHECQVTRKISSASFCSCIQSIQVRSLLSFMIPYFGWAELTESNRLCSTPQGYTIVDPLAYQHRTPTFVAWVGMEYISGWNTPPWQKSLKRALNTSDCMQYWLSKHATELCCTIEGRIQSSGKLDTEIHNTHNNSC